MYLHHFSMKSVFWQEVQHKVVVSFLFQLNNFILLIVVEALLRIYCFENVSIYPLKDRLNDGSTQINGPAAPDLPASTRAPTPPASLCRNPPETIRVRIPQAPPSFSRFPPLFCFSRNSRAPPPPAEVCCTRATREP